MAKFAVVALFGFFTIFGNATGMQTEAAANPIRRVVTMLQMMQKKIEAEAVKEKEMFDKFMCYCKSGKETLAKSIEDAETKIIQLESEIKGASGEKAQLDEDLASHKNDRAEAKSAMAKATAMREKDAAAFAKESAEDKANLASLTSALAAIEKGMAGGFLQTNAAAALRRLTLNQDITNHDRETLTEFLEQGHSLDYAPASGEIVGILKQMKDTMEKDLAEVLAEEEAAKKEYDELMAAKQKEVDSLTKAIEEKTKRVGEVAVDLVNLKEDLDDTTETVAEDKKFLADLEKTCELKVKEWDMRCKTRQEELLALSDTVKILNDDDALELFKKTLPSASFLQVMVTDKEARREALRAFSGFSKKGQGVDMQLILMALHGKKVDFSKVITMIDDMVVLLGKEQEADDTKKAYCEEEFDKADDKKKALERSISDLEKFIEEAKESVTTLTQEIKNLEDGIVKLDRDVVQATEMRKEEHEEFTATLAANNAAMKLIDFAKNRMQKFYNPKLYKPPPKRELTEEERITLNMGGTLAPTNPPGGIAGTGVFTQVHTDTTATKAAPPPPPEATFGGKKSEESGGVIAMMDMMIADIKKEIQEMEFDEKDAQEEYEIMVNEAAEKRAADTKSIEEKTAVKAGLEDEIVKNGDQKAAEEAELMATKQYIADLHADCDWLINNFQTRKDARANEIDALKKAKAVLSGADYSLLQIEHLRHRV